MLPTLDKFLKDNDLPFNNTIKKDNEDHLQEMHQQFSVYFPEGMLNDSQWVRNPFILDSKALPFNLLPKEQEQLLELSCDGTLKSEYKASSLIDFWIHAMNEYEQIADKAVCLLIPFATTYLCETGFSAMTAIKSKYRNRLNLETDLRIKLTNILPNISRLCAKKVPQGSH